MQSKPLFPKKNYALPGIEMIDCKDAQSCAAEAVKLVRSGKADMPMKGLLPTATFMRAVLHKETGLRSDSLITQITVTDRNDEKGLHFISDCAMNISPDLKAKRQIIENAVKLRMLWATNAPK